jgi:hypothetical protein
MLRHPSAIRRTLHLAGAIVLASLLAGSCAAKPSQPRAGGLCLRGETTYFSCTTAHHRSIDLCGSLPGTLQYRFGAPGRIELAFPTDPSQGAKNLRFAHYFRYQVDRTEVTFSNQGTDYAVFDYTEDNRRTAGVHVTLPDGSENDVLCHGTIHGRLATLKGSLRCDSDNALTGGNCP